MNAETENKQRIRMELYKDAYLQWLPHIKKFTGNIAKQEAEKAVAAFDKQFSKDA
jgi:hypothetical protein